MKKVSLLCVAVMVALSAFAKAPESNKLTKKEKRAGWELIFDGKTFNGWSGFNRSDIPGVWTIEDESIKINAASDAKRRDGGDIYFTRKYKNFELSFSWKVSKGANSGVFYLGRIIPNVAFFCTAPEYQILDNANHPDANFGKDGNRRSASLYDMKPAVPQNAKPYDQWNTGKVVVKDGKVTHYQNGKKVLEFTLMDDSWDALVEDSKFKGIQEMHDVGKEAGYISLQDHGNDVWFKDIKVRNLDK